MNLSHPPTTHKEKATITDSVYGLGLYQVRYMVGYHSCEVLPHLVGINNNELKIIGVISQAAWDWVNEGDIFAENEFYLRRNCIVYGADVDKCNQVESVCNHRHDNEVVLFCRRIGQWQ